MEHAARAAGAGLVGRLTCSDRWVSVPNPASGTVSLRATVTDGRGAVATMFVLRAYAIS
jgi:hypothetical protein